MKFGSSSNSSKNLIICYRVDCHHCVDHLLSCWLSSLCGSLCGFLQATSLKYELGRTLKTIGGKESELTENLEFFRLITFSCYRNQRLWWSYFVHSEIPSFYIPLCESLHCVLTIFCIFWILFSLMSITVLSLDEFLCFMYVIWFTFHVSTSVALAGCAIYIWRILCWGNNNKCYPINAHMLAFSPLFYLSPCFSSAILNLLVQFQPRQPAQICWAVWLLTGSWIPNWNANKTKDILWKFVAIEQYINVK